MSASPERHTRTAFASQWPYLRLAAQVEAQQMAHHEVDGEHLLIALVTTTGPAATALGAAGVDADGLRRAVVAVQRQELSALGAADAVPPLPGPGPLHLDAAQELRPSARVEELVGGVDPGADDRALLLALLDDDGARAGALLRHLGVDVAALRTALTGEAPARAPLPRPTGTLELPPAVHGSSWQETAVTQRVAAPPERVWALVSDPARRTEWDTACEASRVDDEGVEHLTLRGDSRRGPLTQRVAQRAAEREITWRRSPATGAPVTEVLQVRVDPDGEAAVVHVRQATLVRRRARTLLQPLLTRLASTQLRVQAQSIGRAATTGLPG